FVNTGNSNLASAYLYGESENGLLFGQTGAGAAYAYDLNTKAYYSFGPANTYPIGANASGYVVGQDGGGTQGFIWNEASQSYKPISGLYSALGISGNSQLVAGQTGTSSSGQAAV